MMPMRAHRGFRKERNGEAQESEGAELQHDCGEHHGTGRRRFDVGVRQPRVKGEHRHLHRERQEECAEQPQPGGGSHTHRLQNEIVGKVRNAGARVGCSQAEIYDGDQHEERANHRVDEELHARVDTTLAAPDADDEVHRHEHHFPHHVEQEEIQRHEHAEHSGREDQHQRVVAVRARPNACPASEDR
jgi:hypothetical protein